MAKSSSKDPSQSSLAPKKAGISLDPRLIILLNELHKDSQNQSNDWTQNPALYDKHFVSNLNDDFKALSRDIYRLKMSTQGNEVLNTQLKHQNSFHQFRQALVTAKLLSAEDNLLDKKCSRLLADPQAKYILKCSNRIKDDSRTTLSTLLFEREMANKLLDKEIANHSNNINHALDMAERADSDFRDTLRSNNVYGGSDFNIDTRTLEEFCKAIEKPQLIQELNHLIKRQGLAGIDWSTIQGLNSAFREFVRIIDEEKTRISASSSSKLSNLKEAANKVFNPPSKKINDAFITLQEILRSTCIHSVPNYEILKKLVEDLKPKQLYLRSKKQEIYRVMLHPAIRNLAQEITPALMIKKKGSLGSNRTSKAINNLNELIDQLKHSNTQVQEKLGKELKKQLNHLGISLNDETLTQWLDKIKAYHPTLNRNRDIDKFLKFSSDLSSSLDKISIDKDSSIKEVSELRDKFTDHLNKLDIILPKDLIEQVFHYLASAPTQDQLQSSPNKLYELIINLQKLKNSDPNNFDELETLENKIYENIQKIGIDIHISHLHNPELQPQAPAPRSVQNPGTHQGNFKVPQSATSSAILAALQAQKPARPNVHSPVIPQEPVKAPAATSKSAISLFAVFLSNLYQQKIALNGFIRETLKESDLKKVLELLKTAPETINILGNEFPLRMYIDYLKERKTNPELIDLMEKADKASIQAHIQKIFYEHKQIRMMSEPLFHQLKQHLEILNSNNNPTSLSDTAIHKFIDAIGSEEAEEELIGSNPIYDLHIYLENLKNLNGFEREDREKLLKGYKDDKLGLHLSSSEVKALAFDPEFSSENVKMKQKEMEKNKEPELGQTRTKIATKPGSSTSSEPGAPSTLEETSLTKLTKKSR